jgi:serine/threonine protein kinase
MPRLIWHRINPVPKSKLLGQWEPTGRTLGEGGQARVIAVTDSQGEHDSTYALKILKSRKDPEEQAYRRFTREIEALKKIAHPSVVRVIDEGQHEGRLFYVMDHVEGAKPLAKYLNPQINPFHSDPLRSIAFAEALLDALQACHTAGVVHRDLSPKNVLICPESLKPMLIDFGVCQVAGAAGLTLVGEGVGSQNYMAPECESGAAGKIDFRADLYSLGKLVWSAITSRPAFSREKPVYNELSMNELFPNNPASWHLFSLFFKTVRAEPDRRFRSMLEAQRDIRNIRDAIETRQPPVEELIRGRCPFCRVGKMASVQKISEEQVGAYNVFGQFPKSVGCEERRCRNCGYWGVVDLRYAQEVLKARKEIS